MPDILKEVFDDHPVAASRTASPATYAQARVLRAVSGDRLQLREPSHGGGGHLLLLRAQRRQAHAQAGRLGFRAQDAGGQGEHRLLIRRAGRSTSTTSSSRLFRIDSSGSSPATSRCSLRLRTSRRSDLGVKARASSSTSAQTTRSTTAPGDYIQTDMATTTSALRIDELHSRASISPRPSATCARSPSATSSR